MHHRAAKPLVHHVMSPFIGVSSLPLCEFLAAVHVGNTYGLARGCKVVETKHLKYLNDNSIFPNAHFSQVLDKKQTIIFDVLVLF